MFIDYCLRCFAIVSAASLVCAVRLPCAFKLAHCSVCNRGIRHFLLLAVFPSPRLSLFSLALQAPVKSLACNSRFCLSSSSPICSSNLISSVSVTVYSRSQQQQERVNSTKWIRQTIKIFLFIHSLSLLLFFSDCLI